MADYSYISNAHPAYIENLYVQYQTNPTAIDGSWAQFFEGFDYALQSGDATDSLTDSYRDGGAKTRTDGAAAITASLSLKEFSVLALIEAYRNRAHLVSNTNPIRQRVDRHANLQLSRYGLSEADKTTAFVAGNELGLGTATLQEIIARLEAIYCQHIGFEITCIEATDRREWLLRRIESQTGNFDFATDKKLRILKKLNDAVDFEKFLHTKYIGQKRFSLEGGETAIAALDAAITRAAQFGTEEIVIGMAHRGRLNVLANTLGKTYKQILNDFEGKSIPTEKTMGSGDVKYHLGYSSQVVTPDGKQMYLKLLPNPSHLEVVNPVVEGFARAKTDIVYQQDSNKLLPILIHGDAAVAGQGVVYETIQMSQLEGYHTGGTLHFVINNQIGFTTDFDDARSSNYCTAAALLVQAPVFHVNGDDPEAVVFAMELAADYRREFRADIFIDMVCYRRHGHNEGDDPEYTNFLLYQDIKDHKNPREVYAAQLIANGVIDQSYVDKLDKDLWDLMQIDLDQIKQQPLPYTYQEPEQAWRELQRRTTAEDFITSPETGVADTQIKMILQHLLTVPADFHPISKVNRLLKNLQKTIDDDKLDWGTSELLAYASLLLEGKDVRMSGQDVKRGTFSHRHAVFFDTDTGKQYNRLNTITPKGQGTFRIYNSLLSEYAVMGFEYGYSLASPNSLVIWEAQFGDFFNGAQTIVDQFITAGETKWNRKSGLVLLLPNGMEGQGPEHSSGRVERFLQQCAEYNMTVANVTSPANFFHLLRRQLHRPFRKPLVVMTPKSLLRHPLCVSAISDFANGGFQELIDDNKFDTAAVAKKVTRVLLCSGKIYYDLLAKQTELDSKNIAIVRLEQIYPFPETQMNAVIAKYPKAELVWVQEEHENMGSVRHLRATHLPQVRVIARDSSASPASGFKKVHDQEQIDIVNVAFA